MTLVDLTDEQLRARNDAKWSLAPEPMLGASVADMDFLLAEPVAQALHRAVDEGRTGYPPRPSQNPVPQALAGFLDRRYGWSVDPNQVVLVADVMAGVELALRYVCEQAPVVVPTPTYPPLMDVVGHSGLPMVPVPLDPDAQVAELDLDRIDAELAAGARTVILCQPHNPWARAFTAAELAGLRDVVLRHGARVVSDEVHAPLVLPGYRHVPYAALDGTADHTVTVTSAGKGWNIPGLKSAQLVAAPADAARLRALPLTANHGSAVLGVVGAVAAYTQGEPWLEDLVARLAANVGEFSAAMRDRLPRARLRPMEATYLAWVDVRAYSEHPMRAAVQRGRVVPSDGATFGPGGAGHLRVNLATSPERLGRIVAGLERAFEG